jgi:hypothetical protein
MLSQALQTFEALPNNSNDFLLLQTVLTPAYSEKYGKRCLSS